MSDTIPSSHCDSLNGRIAGENQTRERANATEKDGETKRRTGRKQGENNARSIVKSRPSRFPSALLSSLLLFRPREDSGGEFPAITGGRRGDIRASFSTFCRGVSSRGEERGRLCSDQKFSIRSAKSRLQSRGGGGTQVYTHTQDTEWIGRDTDETRPNERLETVNEFAFR